MNLPLGNQRLKSFHISGIELLYLPVTQQKADDFVILGILFEYLGRSAVIFLYFAFLCSAVAYLQFFEENFSQLNGRINIEFFPPPTDKSAR